VLSTLHYFVLFKNSDLLQQFEYILSPEGSCESGPKGRPIVFTYVLFWLGNDFDTLKSVE